MRTRDYLEVAASPRYRAFNRHRLRESYQQSTLLVLAVAGANTLWLVPLFPHAAPLIVATNATIAGVAALMFVAGRRLRRLPVEPLLFGLLLIVDAALALLPTRHPDLATLCAGFALLLPIVVALVVVWRTSVHTLWLATHVGIVVAFTLLNPPPVRLGGGPAILIELLLGAAAVSQLGHMINLRAMVRGFIQLQELHVVSRQSRTGEARLQQLNRLLESTARTDDLTGLNNRTGLQLELPVVRAAIARRDATFAFLMLDLDRFKAVNDRLGHVAGDEILRRVADRMVAALRVGDLVFRYGGEEFLVIAEVVDAAAASRLGERIRRHVQDLGLGHPANPPSGVVTLSVGMTLVTRRDLAELSTEWVARADAALYAAKAAGRNRVLLWEDTATGDARRPEPTSTPGLTAIDGTRTDRDTENLRRPALEPSAGADAGPSIGPWSISA